MAYDEFLAEQLKDPEFAAAYKERKAERELMIPVFIWQSI